MSKQPCCGCPVPVINPPEFGAASRFPFSPLYREAVSWPTDPGLIVPRVLTSSAAFLQGTSLGCCLESSGWQPRYPLFRGLQTSAFGGYRNQGLNFAAAEIARLISQILYPVPGIWIGPIRIHLPSGNLLLQLPAPFGGPLDAVPVYSYNSFAARDSASAVTASQICLIHR